MTSKTAAARARLGTVTDVGLLAAAVAVIVVVTLENGFALPRWNAFSLVAVASVPVVIRFGMVVESVAGTLRVSTAPALLFAYDVTQPLLFLPWWAVVALASHLWFFGLRRGAGRGGVEVLAAAAMVGVGRQIDVGLWPFDRVIVATLVFAAVVVVLEFVRARAHGLHGVLRRTDRQQAAIVLGALTLACLVVALLRRAHTGTPLVVTALLGAACLSTFVVAQVLFARLQAALRGIQALGSASQAMPWPGADVDRMLIDFTRAAVRCEQVTIERDASDSTSSPQVSVAVREQAFLTVSRTRGDLSFSRGETGLVRSLVGLATTSRSQALQEEQLRRQATTDELTGLHTYAHFRDRIDALAARRDDEHCIVVVFLDVDGFKSLNTRIGHLEADTVLATLGSRFRSMLPRDVELCRFGGDEFVAVAVRPTRVEAHLLVTKVDTVVQEPMTVAGQILSLKASLGVAVSTDPAEGIEMLIADAEERMRATKHQRRPPKSASQSSVIRRLLDQDGFEVVFQPIVESDTFTLQGVEALVRANDQIFGRLPAMLVVDSVMANDFLDEMTAAVAQRAVATMARVNELGLGRQLLTVNVELEQLRHDSPLIDEFISLSAQHDVSLALEVSERSGAPWTEAHTATAERLRDAGIGLVIDDFGAGHATFTTLRRWKWDLVKIDRMLVAAQGPAQRRLLAHVTNLLQDLNFAVLAEGVETPDHTRFAAELGIEWLQGWAIAKPLGERDLLRRLEASGLRFAPEESPA